MLLPKLHLTALIFNVFLRSFAYMSECKFLCHAYSVALFDDDKTFRLFTLTLDVLALAVLLDHKVADQRLQVVCINLLKQRDLLEEP